MLEIVLVFMGLCALFALVVVGLCIYEAAEWERDEYNFEADRDWACFEAACGEPHPEMLLLDWQFIRMGARAWWRDVRWHGFSMPWTLRMPYLRLTGQLPPLESEAPPFPPDDEPDVICDFCHDEIPNADGLWVFVGGCYPTTGLACPTCYLRYTGYFGASTEADPTPTLSEQAYRAAYHRA